MWRSSGPITMWSSVQLNEGGIFVMVRLDGVFDCGLILLLAGGGNALGTR